MVFQWFSYGFPMVFQWFSNGCFRVLNPVPGNDFPGFAESPWTSCGTIFRKAAKSLDFLNGTWPKFAVHKI